ncbi:MAG: uroporphyrinogen-III synthase [Variovorax sp.]|nr:MAG: uroporphyrinogen-III synthase [Variovorax sp.]
MNPRRVIVTRPAREAQAWIDQLRRAGLDAVALPLLAIEPALDVAPLDAAWQRLQHYAALMFVSAAAVDHFFARQRRAVTDAASTTASASPRYWATGPGTTRALQRAGIHLADIDTPAADNGRFDSEALWERVSAQVRPGVRVLIVRGGDAAGRPTGRDWLADEVAAAGGQRDTVVAYRRLAPAFGAAEMRLAAEGAAGEAIWLFSSSEAVAHLVRAMPSTDWGNARVVATHPRIAEAATGAGFGDVRLAPPLPAALVASIESFA